MHIYNAQTKGFYSLQVKALFNVARNDYGGVHILVNNAGLSHASPLLSGNPKDFKNMCDINIVGLTGSVKQNSLK